MRRVTTKRHYELFQRTFLECVERWGITDTRWDFSHEPHRDARATYTGDHTARCAQITLSTTWESGPREKPVTDREVIDCARHEAAHALLGPISAMMRARLVTQDELTEAEERTVRRLQRVLP